MTKKISSTLVYILMGILTFAQPNETVEMADAMRASGKIYVVVGVLAIIFIGIATYLFILDRKISSVEKKLEE